MRCILSAEVKASHPFVGGVTSWRSKRHTGGLLDGVPSGVGKVLWGILLTGEGIHIFRAVLRDGLPPAPVQSLPVSAPSPERFRVSASLHSRYAPHENGKKRQDIHRLGVVYVVGWLETRRYGW